MKPQVENRGTDMGQTAGRELRLKPFYGRRRVRKLCDHIDSLKVMLDRAVRDCDNARNAYTSLEMAAVEVVNQDRGTSDGEERFEAALHRLWKVLHAE